VKSKLMQLPQEIRDEIYSYVLRSTRVAFGMPAYSCNWRHRVQSAGRGTSLAMLRTCRRMRDEVGISWLSQVMFHFEDPDAMLDKLACLPIGLRKQIRNLRVLGDTVAISDEPDVFYRTAQILKLLPGLELDRLTVLGAKEPELCYETLNMLVRHIDGWKELHYISHNSELQGHRYGDGSSLFDDDYDDDDDPLLDLWRRQPQPSDWQNVVERRDGRASHPSVVVCHGGEVFTQSFTGDLDAKTYGNVEDATLMRAEESGYEILVIVKRSAGVDYAEKEGSPYLAIGDIRKDYPGMTWKDMKAVR
jgi:hypothetical protein